MCQIAPAVRQLAPCPRPPRPSNSAMALYVTSMRPGLPRVAMHGNVWSLVRRDVALPGAYRRGSINGWWTRKRRGQCATHGTRPCRVRHTQATHLGKFSVLERPGSESDGALQTEKLALSGRRTGRPQRLGRSSGIPLRSHSGFMQRTSGWMSAAIAVSRLWRQLEGTLNA